MLDIQNQLVIGSKTEPDIVSNKLEKCPLGLKPREKKLVPLDKNILMYTSTASVRHSEDMSDDKEPLFLIIIGVAGTGKSFLIEAIQNLLQS